ncbi:uncharacterized protein RHOBADRAFT_56002 [Rhodotorula graminis WP1]|uniref:Homeobox domain-containing protein n=1 Tax=Rhodotorula graminis (strain WP1) TaxID=578459 RepID=A0A0P9GXL8_RHOGW|nr:uncharacterized protein RHOBADRAFT_56002 [Rhodotorula graminis WP1]KPV72172.1 hypothetical protein RHOBADRAFT_56002 [Rhodotorula graminis WP1]
MSSIVDFALRVKNVSTSLLRLQDVNDEVERETIGRARQLLKPASHNSSRPLSPSPDPPADDQAHCAPYREYFLAHFSNPYPSPADKDHLLALVPRHTKTQLDTWFVNNRRRSGWAALRRAHTSGSAEAMRRLVDDVDAGVAAPVVADKVARCRAFFDESGRDRVSDEIQAIVRGEPLPPPPPHPLPPPPAHALALAPPSSSRRRIEQRATRGIGQSAPRAHRSPSPPFPPPPSLAREHPVYATSPTELSPLDGGLAQLDHDLAPRYPSTFGSFSSSSTGGRAVSDSSSAASLDSLLSYGTALDEQAPYHGDEVEVHVADDTTSAVTGSPPATLSLLAFAAGLGSSPVRHYPARPAVDSRPAAAHPYFCTVDELPTSSSLVGFASGAAARR